MRAERLIVDLGTGVSRFENPSEMLLQPGHCTAPAQSAQSSDLPGRWIGAGVRLGAGGGFVSVAECLR